MKETALEKFFKTHRRFCAVHIYSGERRCSCGRDEALKEVESLKKRKNTMEDYRIDFKCPRCKKVVQLGSDWAFELNEVLYCPECNYPAFKLVAAYSESEKQPELPIFAREGANE